jgi:uncharacterized protein (TIGR03437 family)
MAIDPVNPTTIYAGSRAGIFKSTDGGASWRLSGRIFTGALTIDSANPNILYAGVVIEGGCYFSDRRLFKSTDGGANWSDSISPPINGCDHIYSLVLSPTEANTLYVANYENAFGDTWTPLIKSNNGGASWIPLYGPPFAALAIDPHQSNTLYAGSFNFPYFGYEGWDYRYGVLKSTDGGVHWNTTGLTNTGVNALAIDPINPSIVYAATCSFSGYPSHPYSFQGLFRSTDSGASWLAINNGLANLIGSRSSIVALIMHPGNPNILYAGTAGDGVYKSIDGGLNWRSFNNGLTYLDVRALVLTPGNLNTLYAATAGGVFKIIDLDVSPSVTVMSSSAASFSSTGLASESIAVSFGAGLATTTISATTLPLPTRLAGASVKVKDSAGDERLAPLFFVSPKQVTYQIPPGTAMGAAVVTVTSGDGSVSTGSIQITAIAPGLFTANANGQGVAAALALRIKADGSQSYEPVVQFDAAQNKFVARPLDLGPEGEQVYLILFGTGIRHRSSLTSVIANIGGEYSEVSFAGSQGDFTGLDQINMLVPRSLVGRGEVDVLLTADAQMANPVRVSFR